MKTNVRFKSNLFSPCKEEDGEVNSGRYGKKLAEYLHSEIQKHDIEVEDIYLEDWGWIVPVKNKDFSVWIGCGNHEEYENGFLCFIEPSKPVIRKWFKKIETTQVVSKVIEAIDEILNTNEDIININWIEQAEIKKTAPQQGK